MKFKTRKSDLYELITYIILYVFLFLGVLMTIIDEHRNTWVLYGITIFFVVILSYINTHVNDNLNILNAFIICLITYPIGCRNSMAMDDYQYENIFKYISNNDWNYLFSRGEEIGFLVFEKILSMFIDNYYWIQFTLFLCFTIVLVLGLQRFKKLFNLPIFYLFFFLDLYFKFMSAGLNRMYVALTIMVWGFWFIYQKKPIHYCVIVGIASLFHISSLFCLIFIPFAIQKDKIKISDWKKYYVIILSIVLSCLSFLLAYFAQYLGNRYLGYITAEYLITIDVTTFIRLFIFFLLFFERKNVIENQKEFYENGLIISWAGILIDIFLSTNSFGRLVYYTDILLIGICSMCVHNKCFSVKKVFYTVIFGIYFVAVFYVTIINVERYYESLFPFHSFFEVM